VEAEIMITEEDFSIDGLVRKPCRNRVRKTWLGNRFLYRYRCHGNFITIINITTAFIVGMILVLLLAKK